MRNTLLSTLVLALFVLIPVYVQAGEVEFSGAIETEITSETEKAGTSTTSTRYVSLRTLAADT